MEPCRLCSGFLMYVHKPHTDKLTHTLKTPGSTFCLYVVFKKNLWVIVRRTWFYYDISHVFTPKGPTPLALLPLGSVTSCVADYSSVCQPSAFHPQSSCAALHHPCQHRARSDVFTSDCGREWQWHVLPWWRICGSSFCVLVELKLRESSMSAGHGYHAWCMC